MPRFTHTHTQTHTYGRFKSASVAAPAPALALVSWLCARSLLAHDHDHNRDSHPSYTALSTHLTRALALTRRHPPSPRLDPTAPAPAPAPTAPPAPPTRHSSVPLPLLHASASLSNPFLPFPFPGLFVPSQFFPLPCPSDPLVHVRSPSHTCVAPSLPSLPSGIENCSVRR